MYSFIHAYLHIYLQIFAMPVLQNKTVSTTENIALLTVHICEFTAMCGEGERFWGCAGDLWVGLGWVGLSWSGRSSFRGTSTSQFYDAAQAPTGYFLVCLLSLWFFSSMLLSLLLVLFFGFCQSGYLCPPELLFLPRLPASYLDSLV